MFKHLLIISLLPLVLSCGHEIPFDSEMWKNAPVSGPEMSTRWDMSNDLIENYDLIGKDTAEVFKLLGREEYNCSLDRCIVYYALGPCRSGIDYGTLDLTFKEDRVVAIFKHCN